MSDNANLNPDMTRSGDDVTPFLIEYTRGRDVACPMCGQSVSNMTGSTCPHCGRPLTLSVGAPRPRFGWILAAIAPGVFSGLAGMFLLIPLSISWVQHGRSPAPWSTLALIGFGLLSGLCAIGTAVLRRRFLLMPTNTQRMWAGLVWLVHLTVFAFFVLMVLL